MIQQRFDEEIEAINRRFEEIIDSVPAQGRQQPLLGAFTELRTSLEELQVANEEMQVQNEMLQAADQQIEAERARYQDLFDSAPDAYLVTDTLGMIREANRLAFALLQAGPRSLIGRPLVNFLPAEERRAFRQFLLDAPRLPAPAAREMRLLSARGTAQTPVEVSAVVAPAPESGGRPASLRWLVRPLAVQTELERYRLLVQETRDYAIILIDSQGNILDWNSGASQIFGYAAEEVRGSPFTMIFTEEDRDQSVPEGELAMAAEMGRALDERWHQRKDGSRFWASGVVIAMPRLGGGPPRWFAKVLRDATERKEQEARLANDLAHAAHVAETFQRGLLPDLAASNFPGLRVTALYEAAWREALVGGDFYDVFALAGGRIALAVGDVSGKGLGAAVRMADLKSVLRAFLREHRDPAGALSRLNDHLCEAQHLDGILDHAYATLALVVLDPETGAAEAAVAGAEPPLVLRTHGEAEPVPVQGRLLGAAPKAEYVRSPFRLAAGDTLLLATDGLTEARRGADFLDYAGLAEIVRRAGAQADLTAMGRTIVGDVRAFAGGAFRDDACLLLARREE